MADVELTKTYRETDYGDIYRIRIERESDGRRRIYCTQSPNNPWRDRVNDHHLYSSGELCIQSGREPYSLERALALAGHWMMGYSAFCRTGKWPKVNKRRLNVE